VRPEGAAAACRARRPGGFALGEAGDARSGRAARAAPLDPLRHPGAQGGEQERERADRVAAARRRLCASISLRTVELPSPTTRADFTYFLSGVWPFSCME